MEEPTVHLFFQNIRSERVKKSKFNIFIETTVTITLERVGSSVGTGDGLFVAATEGAGVGKGDG